MIGDRIRELRKEKDISQEELGKVAGVTTSAIGMYETNVRQPSYEVLKKICEYFDVSSDYLLEITDIRKYDNSEIYIGIDADQKELIEEKIKKEIKEKIIRALES